MTLHRRFLAQALVWTLYALVSLAMMRAWMPVTSGVVVIMVLVAGGMWAGTEALRAVVLRRRWLDLPGASLALRLALLPPVVATAIQLAVALVSGALLATGLVSMPAGARPPGWGALGGYVANTTIMLWLWLAAWGGVQFLQRWRQGEVEKWQAEATRRSLELEVLRAQVNPHFIFNALNNLRALITEDPARAREAVTHLSNTLRHTLYHGAREQVPLAEELAIVRDYVALEQLHFEDRLRVRWSLDDGLDDVPVPPMVMQLLVENAIKHGISRTPGGGEVSVSVAREAGRVAIAVTNPGRFEPGPSRGLGLGHLRERLARAGGPGADCRIEQDDGRVRVVVTLGTEAACAS